MQQEIVIFTDRDGDKLSVTPGDESNDPIITITHSGSSQSVVGTELDIFLALQKMCGVFGYDIQLKLVEPVTANVWGGRG